MKWTKNNISDIFVKMCISNLVEIYDTVLIILQK